MKTDRNLYNDNLLMKPQAHDWSEGYAESWDIVRPDFFEMEAAQLFEFADDYGVELEADPRELSREELVAGLESIGVTCYDEESDSLLADAYGDSQIAGDLDGPDRLAWCDACLEYYEESAAPAMNYRYSINIDRIDSAQDAVSKLCNLPLTLIEDLEDGEFYLALTGGGMDLSAEICRAYIELGQRPPVHFCELPRMAGRKYEQDFIAICIESCEIAQRWAQSTIDDLKHIAADHSYSEQEENAA